MLDDHSPFAKVYEQILTADLQRAIDLLKFAETKNGALLALASAWVFAGIGIETAQVSKESFSVMTY